MDTLDIERAGEHGGDSADRKYNRDAKGTTTGGQFTAGSAKPSNSPLTNSGTYHGKAKGGGGGGAKEQPKAPSSAKFKTLAPGEDNDGQAVAEMQQLLTALGLGNLTSGQYDTDTENAVKEAQRRLGIKPNGKANKALVTKMLNAYDLSPCVKRSETSDEEEIQRKFDPSQARDRRGRWSLTAALVAAFKAAGGKQGGASFDDGRYFDWSSYDPDTHNYNLEIGDGEDAVQFDDIGDYELEQLYSALTVTRLRDNPPEGGHPPAVAALAQIGHADHMVFGEDSGAYIDWSTRTDAGDYGFGVSNGEDSVEFDLSPAELDKLIASLALSTQEPMETGRARSIERSEEPEPDEVAHSAAPCDFEVTRSEGDVFDTLRASTEDDEDEPVARAHTNPREPEEHTPGHAPCCPDVLDDEAHVFRREWSLDGIDIIRGGQGGDGRTVEAYASVFDAPTEVKDQHGHYMETIHRSAFDEVLRGGINRVKCFYNHGLHMNGQPSDRWSVPIGTPLEIRADGKGLRTITRFNQGADADQILEAIRNNAITGYSFRGPIRQSDPPRIPRARNGMDLPTVTRMKLGLTEYGPTPAPYYAGAGVLALRSRLSTMDPNLLVRLVDLLSSSTPEDQEALRTALSATPASGPGAEDQPQALRSATAVSIRRKIAMARTLGGLQ